MNPKAMPVPLQLSIGKLRGRLTELEALLSGDMNKSRIQIQAAITSCRSLCGEIVEMTAPISEIELQSKIRRYTAMRSHSQQACDERMATVEQLMNQGLSGNEIRKATGYGSGTVCKYMRLLKKAK